MAEPKSSPGRFTVPVLAWQHYISPRYWLMWLLFGGLKLSIFLPYSWAMTIGGSLGRLMYWVLPKRRQVAATNLALCFPTLNPTDQKNLLWQSARHLGYGVAETARAWWASDQQLQPLIRQVNGLAIVEQAIANQQPVLLLSAHVTCLDIGGRFLSMLLPSAQYVYKKARHPLFNAMMVYRRSLKYNSAGFERKDTRGIIRSLRAGRPIWYAPDQNFNTEELVFAPFFGTPAATVTATARLARLGKAIVIPYLPKRVAGGYELSFLPPIENFPSGDDLTDATRVNQIVEQAILAAPEQYMWVHKRFKNRPPDTPAIY